VIIVFGSLASFRVILVIVIVIVLSFIILLLDSCVPICVLVALDLLPQGIVAAAAAAAAGPAWGSSPRRFLRVSPVLLGP
jgi:hypothetical protein